MRVSISISFNFRGFIYQLTLYELQGFIIP